MARSTEPSPATAHDLPALWKILIAVVPLAVLVGGLAAWVWLPRLAPDAVVIWSPWLEPVLRARGGDRLGMRGRFAFMMRVEHWHDRDAALGAATRSANPDVRVAALMALGNFPMPATLPAVVACLDDEDPRVRIQALRALRRQPADPDVARRLLAALAATPAERVAAIGSLEANLAGPLRPAIVAALIEATRHPDAAVRVAAVARLGPVDDAEVRDALAGRLDDQDEPTQRAALAHLCRLADPRAMPTLRARLAEETDPAILRELVAGARMSGHPALADAVLDAAVGSAALRPVLRQEVPRFALGPDQERRARELGLMP